MIFNVLHSTVLVEHEHGVGKLLLGGQKDLLARVGESMLA